MNYKKNLKIIILVLAVIVIGTVIDYFVHSTNPDFSVPAEYFINKIIFGTVWGSIFVFILRRYIKNPRALAAGVSLGVAIVLQTKYFLQGYNLYFVFLFMILHFLMFLVPAWLLFKKWDKVVLDIPVKDK